MTTLEKPSPAKVNLILNILRRRSDGFHELESVFHHVNVCDRLSFRRGGSGLQLTCSIPELPTDSGNLVFRAATKFLETAKITEGVSLHLEKQIPLAAGLGGGSGNAATALLGLNEIFGQPLSLPQLHEIAATLGSDVNFFLQTRPALATGRGEQVESLENFAALRGVWILLVHPGFGISTPWAYRELARFPAAVNGRPGRARQLATLLQTGDLTAASREFYNSLEAPALEKYPVLALYQEFFRANGAAATLMSGSGSATFALFPSQAVAEHALEGFKSQFGASCWTALVPL